MAEYADRITHLLIFLAVLTTIIIICVGFENIYWNKRDKSKVYNLKETIANASLGFGYKVMDAVAVALYVFFLFDYIKPYGLNVQIENPVIRIIVLFLVVDLAFWFTHFCMHKVRWFWAGHVTHHSSDRYNYSVALRQNFTVVINGALLIWWMPVALIGFDKEEVLLIMEINLLYQFLLHTEMPSVLDKFGKILNTPSHHRVHHGSNETQLDRNFAGSLIIWDKLFGTFVSEKDAGDIVYGITRNQPKGYNVLLLTFHEWRDIFKDLIKYKDFRVLYKSPGWVDKQDDTKKTIQANPKPTP